MSETTQILFNSPALHSLKRDQLVKLCKIHSIKASGKNIDLVQRLKDHASTLPPGDPLRVAVHPDNQDDLRRPSDQWEVVMEDIPEMPEPSRTTLSSLRSVTSNAPDEFGTGGGGSKSSSMSSSLKAIANSFKRATSDKSSDSRIAVPSFPRYPDITDELASHSVPYSSIPEPLPSDMPQTDHFKFSTPDTTILDNIQSQPTSPGTHPLTNATPNPIASPSKTTIRLVSVSSTAPSLPHEPGTPHLKPVDPVFDLVMGSPDAKGQTRVPVWPLSPHPAPSERLYPALPIDELEQNEGETKSAIPGSTALTAGSTSKPKVYPRPSNKVQDMFSPAPKPPSARKESLGITRSEPFLFGSPLPRHSVSNKAFDAAAASVLDEMNKRLSAAGVQKVDADVFGGVAIAKTTNATSLETGALGKADRFDKMHEEQFNKMDSIATHYAARRSTHESKKRKSDVLGHGSAPGQKRSSAGTRVISAGSRKRMGIPGGFDEEEEEELPDDVQEEEDRRMSKRVRVLEGDGGKDKGRRLTISPTKTKAEEKQAEKERSATRKMLDARKEKRRSSRHGRISLAGPQASNNKGKAKPRFGFFSSAKSIARSVWNFGAGSPAKASRATTATTTAATQSQTAEEPKQAKPGPLKKPSFSVSRPSEAPLSRKSVAPSRTVSTSIKAPTTAGTTGTEPSRSRPPSSMSNKNGPTNSRSTSLSSNAAARALNPTPAGSTSSRRSVLAGSANNASSFGTKGSFPRSSATNLLSAGSQRRTVPGPTSNGAGATKTTLDESAAEGSNNIFSPSRATATSRLFAPTASSLAKTRSPAATAGAKSRTSSIVAQRAKSPPRNSALDTMTNSPRRTVSSSAAKIFSTPLLAVPPPVRPTSLAAAAAAVLAATSPERASTNKPGGQQQNARKPRISRSRIIAKLGAQRAAAAASPSSTTTPRSTARGGGSKIPTRASGGGGAARTLRVRSSMGAATRRSYAGAKTASRESDVLMSAKKHVRQSEYVRRRSRLAGSTVGVSAGLPMANHAADGPDGTMAMDIDDD